jgi:hypothetical protein
VESTSTVENRSAYQRSRASADLTSFGYQCFVRASSAQEHVPMRMAAVSACARVRPV